MSDAVPLLDMLRAGAHVLASEAREQIAAGVQATRTADGGFAGRDGRSDLYYAPFALWVLGAVGQGGVASADSLAYLQAFGDGSELDATHRASLVMAWVLAGRRDAAIRVAERSDSAARRVIRAGETPAAPGVVMATAYARFLTVLALQAVGMPVSQGGAAASSGKWGDTTPEAAAGMLLCVWEGTPVPESLVAAVRVSVSETGGLRASPRAPSADLLSTATGLLALRAARPTARPTDVQRHVEFVTACWRDTGLFASAPDDPDERGDVEYAFYALLALGALAR